MDLGNGILIGVPIPEEYAALAKPIESAIDRALHEAKYVSFFCFCHNGPGCKHIFITSYLATSQKVDIAISMIAT